MVTRINTKTITENRASPITPAVRAATAAVESGSAADDSRYQTFENRLTALTNERDTVALQISRLLESATSGSGEDAGVGAQARDDASVSRLVREARSILARAANLAAGD